MAAYKSKIPEIENFKLEVIRKARMTGCTETFYGRKRFLPNITSPKSYDRSKAERQVVNTMIQGSGADIVKCSLVSLHNEGFKIDTMLHDGILITIPDSQLNQSVKRIKEIMEQDLNGMKLPVTCKVGKSWGACK